MSDQGSALVESIAVMALIALLATALISLSQAVQTHLYLTHVATLGARAGAIGGKELAVNRVARLVDAPVKSRYWRSEKASLCFFEVELSRSMRTAFGTREIKARAHAVCEQ